MPQVASLDVALAPAGDGGLAAVFECHCCAGALRLPETLRLPELRPAEAADELWRHTCCELYVGVVGDVAYREFIWSPSGQWAMYDLSDYRVRNSIRLNLTLPAPVIRFASDAAGWTLQTRINAAALPGVAGEQIELGVAVVLEAADGNLSYWALRHAATRPDFHRRESFVLRLSDLA